MEQTPFGAPFLVVEEVSSTNTYLMERLEQYPHGTAVLALHQSAGKGRLSRLWSSQEGAGMYLSFVLKGLPIPALAALPCACAVAVCRALEGLDVTGAQIKWPNDVVLNQKKLCGILCESRLANGLAQAVCGIGVNLTQTQSDFAQQGLLHATSILGQTGKAFGAKQLAQSVLQQMAPLAQLCQAGAPYPFLPEYTSRCVNIGRQVRLIVNQQERVAFAKGVDEQFSLLCEIDGQTTAISAGEVSVRGLYGYV